MLPGVSKYKVDVLHGVNLQVREVLYRHELQYCSSEFNVNISNGVNETSFFRQKHMCSDRLTKNVTRRSQEFNLVFSLAAVVWNLQL